MFMKNFIEQFDLLFCVQLFSIIFFLFLQSTNLCKFIQKICISWEK